MPEFPSLSDHLLIWVFGIILPFISGLQSHQLSGSIQLDARSRRKLYLSNSLMLAFAGSSVLLLWITKDRPLSTIGFNPPNWSNWHTLLIIVFVFTTAYLADLLVSIKKSRKRENEIPWYERSSFLPNSYKEIPAYIVMCIAAGIFEEIIYRGFMITYFSQENSNSSSFPWLSLIAPSALFSLAHYYQGWSAVAKIFIFSLLLSLIFINTKSIYPTMLIHFCIDLISGISAMNSLKNKNEN